MNKSKTDITADYFSRFFMRFFHIFFTFAHCLC